MYGLDARNGVPLGRRRPHLDNLYCYGQLPVTVYCGPLSTAGAPFWECGTVTVAVAVLALPEASVTLNVIL